VAEQREWRRPEQAVAEQHHPQVGEVDSPARAVAAGRERVARADLVVVVAVAAAAG
jgi:hypothetical protein